MKWFRLYSEVLDDPKVQQLRPALFKHWINLLCLASQTDDGGTLPDVDAIAFRLRIRKGECRKILDELVAANLLEVCGVDAESLRYSAHNWQKRQRSSDNVAQRVAKHRAGNAENVTLQATLLKRPVDTDTDTDTDKGVTPLTPLRRPDYPADFEAFWAAYPTGRGSKKKSYERWKQLKPSHDLVAEIMAGLASWNASDQWARGFVKAAERWLSDRMWENPPPQPQSRASPGHHGTTNGAAGGDAVLNRFLELAAEGTS